ncbi:MAG: hypothetical protein M3O50_19995 [Myxococcota bacterium]|nr:hypothetical protein [Myxococcota bacterium]
MRSKWARNNCSARYQNMRSSFPPRRAEGASRRPAAISTLSKAPPALTAARFLASMPRQYRDRHEKEAAAEHAAIVARRGQAAVHAEIWRELPDGGAIICVVADDRPGLLSLITAALAAERMDITAAHAYTRALADGAGAEAVDFLWLRRGGASVAPIRARDIGRVVDVLRALVAGERTPESFARRSRPPPPSRPAAPTRVSFDTARDAGHAVLTIETSDRPGLLLAVTLALFRAQVQIIATEATTRNGRVVDRFTVAEQDGSPLRSERHDVVQTAVASALKPLHNAPRSRPPRS